MEFGDWLRSRRQYRKLDVRTLAERSQVDPSTISRIENLHTQSTLYTAYRLCKGLQVASSELYYGLSDTSMVVREQIPDDKKNAISLADMELLLDTLTFNYKDIYYYFAEVLNQISIMMSRSIVKHPDIYPQFTPENMEALLSGAYSSAFHFDLDYPHAIDSDIIRYNYEHGGVLLLDDIGAYARNIRRSQKETLKTIENSTEISMSVLSRLEDGALERIKLSDIFTLDTALKQTGLLLDMCWDACSFDEWVENKLKKYKTVRGSASEESKRAQQMILLYIKVCRWFQSLQGSGFEWPKYRPSKDENEAYS